MARFRVIWQPLILPFDPPALLPPPLFFLAVFLIEGAQSMLLAFFEIALVAAAIDPLVGTVSVHLVLVPVAFVTLTIGPDKLAMAAKHIISEVAGVVSAVGPPKLSQSVLLICLPVTLVEEAFGAVDVPPPALSHILLPPPLITRTVLHLLLAPAMPHWIAACFLPLAYIHRSSLCFFFIRIHFYLILIEPLWRRSILKRKNSLDRELRHHRRLRDR